MRLICQICSAMILFLNYLESTSSAESTESTKYIRIRWPCPPNPKTLVSSPVKRNPLRWEPPSLSVYAQQTPSSNTASYRMDGAPNSSKPWAAALFPSPRPRDPALAYFGLGPYPAILSAMALGSFTKHIVWILGISEQEMTPTAALVVGAVNVTINTLSTMFSLWTLTSAAP